ncbi:MAG TPA: hypothetical protein VK179_00540 [Bacteroidales bacterium]|nr:hypothetical protein [Bacteroidales bacterium]
MLNENEVVMLILGIGVLFLIIMNLDHIRKINSWVFLIASYCFLLTAWVFTVLEGFFLENLLNFSEHISYAVSSVLLLIWCHKATQKKKQEAKA